MTDRETLEQRQKALQDVYEAVKAQLMLIPGVVGVGIGFKEKGGELTDEISFRVYVSEKKDKSQLAPNEMIPDEIMGFKTDVIKVYQPSLRVFTERRDDSKFRPLQGGICINAEDKSGKGTLGWFGTRNSDSARILLTNKHVLYSKSLETTTATPKVGQPSYSTFCCCDCGQIGTAVIGIKDSNVDCAIATLNSDVVIELVLNNSKTTENISVTGTTSAVVGETVRKVGMRSSFTTGVVIDIGAVTTTPPTDPAGTPVTVIANQILIRPATGETYEIENGKIAFSNYGDSGSVIVNASGQIIGLLYSGDENSYSVDITFANNISNVLSALSSNGNAITLSVSPAGDGRLLRDVRTPFEELLELTHPGVMDSIPLQPVGSPLERMIERIQTGDLSHLPVAKALRENFTEILELVNKKRSVTVTWHRKQGPAYTGAFMRSLKEPGYRVPREIEGVSRQALLTSMVVVLDEHCSENLHHAINDYALMLINAGARYDTLEEFLQSLKYEGALTAQPILIS